MSIKTKIPLVRPAIMATDIRVDPDGMSLSETDVDVVVVVVVSGMAELEVSDSAVNVIETLDDESDSAIATKELLLLTVGCEELDIIINGSCDMVGVGVGVGPASTEALVVGGGLATAVADVEDVESGTTTMP